MKKIISQILFACILTFPAFAQHVGIGTEDPQAMLDINGDVVFRTADITIVDSSTLALDVNTAPFSRYRIVGADSAFVVAGITAGMDGRVVTFINHTGFPMQMNHEDTSAAFPDRIVTGNQLNLVLEDMGTVTIQYDSSAQKWVVNSSNIMTAESVWDTAGTNIFFQNYVGIGTEEPTSPLTIETGLNETGFTHMAMTEEGPVKLESSISDLGAAIGTTSDDIFSLNTGGTGKVHVLPDGRVVIGDDADPNNLTGGNTSSRMTPIEAKLTLETPINTNGWMHIGGADSIIVREAIGGVSASIGTETNHTFRLVTGAQGRVHIGPDGNVVFGDNTSPAYGKVTAHTPNQSFGFVQAGADGQILATKVGGPNGSATVGTYSAHHFRLMCNSLSAISIVSPSLNVGIGLDFPTYKFEVNGTMRAKELIIETTGWPDYVFEKEYKSLSLDELDRFIKEHHHLPNIPSARQMEETGIAVGNMQKKMMEKIEELTLYVIQLKKEIDDLKQLKD